MSTPSKDSPVSDADLAPARPERAQALRDLSAALAQLGQDASRATRSSNDVRWHVVACQAGHLAGEVWDLVALDGVTDQPLPAAVGLASSVTVVRTALRAPEAQPLPAALAASVSWLLELADAVAS